MYNKNEVSGSRVLKLLLIVIISKLSQNHLSMFTCWKLRQHLLSVWLLDRLKAALLHPVFFWPGNFFLSIFRCRFNDHVPRTTSGWHREDAISGNLLKCSLCDLEAACFYRSGTWPAGNWNSPWLDTSVQCEVWRSAHAAPTCSPVEKTSKSSVGIWSTTRYDMMISESLMQ